MRRFLFLMVVLLGAAFSGCGDDPADDVTPNAMPDDDVAWDLPPGVTLTFALDFARAIAMGRVDDVRDRSELVDEALAVIRKRLDAAGVADAQVEGLAGEQFAVTLPLVPQDRQDAVVGIVTSLDTLAFRVEVLPEYDTESAEDRTRKHVWPGTPEEFAEFKRLQVEAWRKAQSDGTVYASTNPLYTLVKKSGTDGSAVEHFHVLEVPKSAHRFDGSILANPVVSQDMSGRPAVLFDIKNAYQNLFAEWTQANLGLPMAIVVNDEYLSAPYVRAKLTDSIQITLGTMSVMEAETEAQRLVTALQFGQLRVRPRLVSVARSP